MNTLPKSGTFLLFHPVYWNILTMHGPINIKSPNNTSKWQMGLNLAFKELNVDAKPEKLRLSKYTIGI
jgi:hypothetical protein